MCSAFEFEKSIFAQSLPSGGNEGEEMLYNVVSQYYAEALPWNPEWTDYNGNPRFQETAIKEGILHLARHFEIFLPHNIKV